MSSQTITITLFAVIATFMAACFVVVWWRDKRNADRIEADPERLDTATEPDGAGASDGTPSTSVPTTKTPF